MRERKAAKATKITRMKTAATAPPMSKSWTPPADAGVDDLSLQRRQDGGYQHAADNRDGDSRPSSVMTKIRPGGFQPA